MVFPIPLIHFIPGAGPVRVFSEQCNERRVAFSCGTRHGRTPTLILQRRVSPGNEKHLDDTGAAIQNAHVKRRYATVTGLSPPRIS